MNILSPNNAWTICASALIASCVLLLQNATVNADRLEERLSASPTLPISDALTSLVRWTAHTTRAEELNRFERDTLNSLTSRFSSELAANSAIMENALSEESGDTFPTTNAASPTVASANESVQETTARTATAVTDPAPAEYTIAVDTTPTPVPPVVLEITVANPEPVTVPEAPDSVASVSALTTGVSARIQILSQRVDHALMIAMAQAAVLPAPEKETHAEAPSFNPPATHQQSDGHAPIPGSDASAAPEATATLTEATGEEEPALAQAPPMHCRILLLGDSLMEDMGPRVHKALQNRRGLEFIISAKFSTGLCRPDFFNWPEHMREVVSKYKPNLVVFFLGANDGMPMRTENRKYVQPGTAIWRETYKSRIDELVSIARKADMDIIWIELPAVGGRYNKLLRDTQVAQHEYCEDNGIENLQTDPLFSGVWGKYETFGEYNGRTVRLRRKDLVHLAPSGNRKVLDHLLPILEKHLISFYHAHPECALSEEEAAGIGRCNAIYTCRYDRPKRKPKPKPQQQLVAPPPVS